MSIIALLNRADLNNDGIGYVEQYDFSRANLSYETRVEAITTVASVCYANPKSIGSESLYNRLALESKGLPSSSFEVVPVVLTRPQIEQIASKKSSPNILHIFKYGEVLDAHYLLTNLRALISDIGSDADNYYNTLEECEIIAKHFKVFKSKIDLSTRAQYIRHRASWQELSRRYVSGKKQEFEFYISRNFDRPSTLKIIDDALQHYYYLVAHGVKPEEARRILPQCMYTTLWSAWQPAQLANFFKLRLDHHAQAEIRELAFAKQTLLGISTI
jgi:thymidylate synthase (FAD)